MSIKIMQEVMESAPVEKGTLLVLIALADSADETTRECWPSVKRLAARARLSERQAQACLRQLEEVKIISVEANAGRSGTNLYRVTRPETWGVQKLRGGEAHFTGGVKPTSPGGVKPTSPEPSYRTITEPSDIREDEPFLFSAMDQPEPKVETSDRFEEFWNVYPKKTGKKAARAKFAAAVKAGADADALIEGARRYADACVGRDPHFIKWPQGWLSEERWTDDPEPPEPTRSSGHRISAPWGEVVR